MPRKCVYAECSRLARASANRPLHYYTFPADLEKRRIWVERSGNTAALLRHLGTKYRNTFLCELHFDNTQFYDSRRTKLIRTALPRPYVKTENESTNHYVESLENPDLENTSPECGGEEILPELQANEEPVELSGRVVGDNVVEKLSAPAAKNSDVSTVPARSTNPIRILGPSCNVQNIPRSSEVSTVRTYLSSANIKRAALEEMKNELCRICGKKNEMLSPIHNEEQSSAELPLKKKLEMYLPIEINTTEDLPPNICSKCLKFVESWHEFYIACSTADVSLRELFDAEKRRITSEIEEIRSQKENGFHEDDVQDSVSSCFEKQSKNECNLTTRNMQAIQKTKVKPAKIIRMLDLPPASMPSDNVQMNVEKEKKSQRKSVWETDSDFYKFYENLKNGPLHNKNVAVRIKPFTCKYCHAIFASWYEYHPHTEKCKTEPTICEECGVVISRKSLLTRHRISHFKPSKAEREKVSLICEICGKQLKTNLGLRRHKENFHSGKPRKKMHSNQEKGEPTCYCEPCCRVFVSNICYKMHMKQHEDGSVKNCINLELTATDGDSSKLSYNCPVCGMSFPDKMEVLKHMNTKNVTKCLQCRNNIANEKHTLTHKCKYWYCPICSKQYWSRSAAKSHELVHTGERPYMCHVCGKKLTTSQSLRRHRKSHDLPVFKCDQCSKIFRNEVLFQIHSEAHLGKLRKLAFKCEHCNKSFSNRILFKIHVDRHDRAYFNCLYCEKQLMYQKSLLSHYKKFHKESFPLREGSGFS